MQIERDVVGIAIQLMHADCKPVAIDLVAVLQPRLHNTLAARHLIDQAPKIGHQLIIDIGQVGGDHQLNGDADNVSFDLHSLGRPMSQVLGAVYALERLDFDARRALAPVLHRALRWRGPIGPSFVADISGVSRGDLVGLTDPRVWALDLLGFPMGTVKVTKKEVMARFRVKLRDAHPDHGGDDAVAGDAIERLGEARRILLQS